MSRLHRISTPDAATHRADVVFVHGLGGDPFATWRCGEDDSSSWPHWLAEALPEVGVWSLGYAASPSKWTRWLWRLGFGSRDSGHALSLPDRALQVLDRMLQEGLGTRPLLFVCHSLGGLLAKQILRKSNDATEARKQRIAEQTRAVLFLATPHAGAGLATLAAAFRTVFATTVSVDDLREHDHHLADLHDWFRNHAPRLSIETRTYYETRGVLDVLPIVNRTSSHPGVGADPVPLDEDHLSIAKPRERDAPVCLAALELLCDHVLAARPAGVVAAPATPAAAPLPSAPATEIVLRLDGGALAAEPPRIPREMPPAAHRFFGRAAEREQLAARLRAGLDTAVVGPAGMGKTALAAAALADVVGANAERLADSPFPDGLVFLDLYQLHGEAEPTWSTLANRISGAGFLERRPARERATEACRARRLLVVVEGGEEADGTAGRATIPELFTVLSPENRRLLLTRTGGQAAVAETVDLREALEPADAAGLLDFLTARRPLDPAVRQAVLKVLQGHPLALHWAGNLLALDEEDPAALAAEWRAEGLPRLSDPTEARRTLRWLFGRSVRGLDEPARRALAAAGLLARAPFPLAVIAAAVGGRGEGDATGEGAAREALKVLVRRGLLGRAEGDQWQFTHVLGHRFARDEGLADPEPLPALGGWLHGRLEATMRAGGDPATARALATLLQHATALLAADRDRRLWEPLARNLLYGIADRLEDLGRLDLVRQALEAVADWLARLPADLAEEPSWRHQHCVLLVDQGDVLRDQGDLAGALAAYQDSLAIARRLAEVDPSNAGWQRDLGVSQERIGDVLRDQGDLDGALAAYQDSLAVRRRLAETDPSNAGWQRDLSVSLNKIGDVLRDQGDLDGALAAYRDSLAVRRRLAEVDPSNAGWQRDLSVSLNRVGDVLRDQGDLAGALAAYQDSLAMRRRLAEADPSNAGWQGDLSVSLKKVGDVLRDQGDLDGALAAYQNSLAIRRRLAEADPSNAGWQSDLSYSLTVIAQLHERQGDCAAALPLAEESLAIDERLAALDRTNVRWQKDVAVSRALVARLRGGDG